jgi:sigma-B regulation protein RsbU (phosphoserine phosphatase)
MLQTARLFHAAPSRVGGLTIETVYEPARQGSLANAFYDSIRVEDRIALVIGEIYGVGARGAVQCAMVRSTLRALLREYADVGAAVGRLNGMLYRAAINSAAEDQWFLGLVVVLYDIGTGNFEVVISGAERPMIIRADHTLKSLKTHGLPLGIFPDVECAPMRDRLSAGDLLLLNTDGLTDARVGNGALGSAGLFGLLAAVVRTAPPERIGDSLVRKVLESAGDRLDHDICVLVACRS